MSQLDRANLTVLVIDDEPDILELLEEEFQDCGYKTEKALCGNDAIKILEERDVDIVVSDFKMPNGNGMKVLEKVQSIDTSKRPHFFFVSGQADVSVEECLQAGALKFFHKPFDLEELIKEVEEEISKRN